MARDDVEKPASKGVGDAVNEIVSSSTSLCVSFSSCWRLPRPKEELSAVNYPYWDHNLRAQFLS